MITFVVVAGGLQDVPAGGGVTSGNSLCAGDLVDGIPYPPDGVDRRLAVRGDGKRPREENAVALDHRWGDTRDAADTGQRCPHRRGTICVRDDNDRLSCACREVISQNLFAHHRVRRAEERIPVLEPYGVQLEDTHTCHDQGGRCGDPGGPWRTGNARADLGPDTRRGVVDRPERRMHRPEEPTTEDDQEGWQQGEHDH